jgi:hypothetical protein
VDDYPQIPIAQKQSRQVDRDGRFIDLDGIGISRIRKTAPDRADFSLVHPYTTEADSSTLMAFYAAHPSATFNYTWPPDGNTYQVRFGAAPKPTDTRKDLSGAWRRTYEVKLLAAA